MLSDYLALFVKMQMKKITFKLKYLVNSKFDRLSGRNSWCPLLWDLRHFSFYILYSYWFLVFHFFLTGLELDSAELPAQMSFSDWPELRRIFTERFASKAQADWSRIFDGTDACVTPVLSFDQVSSHPHNQERASFMKDSDGEESPRPAPVLSRTPAVPCLTPDPVIGEHTVEVLEQYGFTSAEIKQMFAAGVVGCNAAKAKL